MSLSQLYTLYHYLPGPSETRSHFEDMDTYNPMMTLFVVFEPTDAVQSYDLALNTQYSLSLNLCDVVFLSRFVRAGAYTH